MKLKRWSEIDALYAIGIILVVFGHSHSSDWNDFAGTILNPIITFIYTFHMPLFFFIAGFLFMNSNSLEKIGYAKWIKYKVERLLTPYVVLSVVTLFTKYYVEHHGFENFTLGYFLEIIFVPRAGVWGHFWFLPVLMILYLMFGIWKNLVKGKNYNLVFVFTTLAAIVLYFLPYSTDWFGFGDFKKVVVFFTFGMLLNHYKKYIYQIKSLPFRIILLLMGLAVSMILVKYCYDAELAMLFIALIMIYVCWHIAVLIKDNPLCKWLSYHNFTIYIYSWPFRSVIMVLLCKMNFPWYLTTLCMFLTGLAVPILIVLIYGRAKMINNHFLDLLLGFKREEK